MPHLGQLTMDGFFVISTKAPQSLQMMRALIGMVAACFFFFASAMESPFPIKDFHSAEAAAFSGVPTGSRLADRAGIFKLFSLYRNPAF